MRVDLKNYSLEHELYVNCVLILVSEEMGAREALEAIGYFSRDVEFVAIELRAGETMQLFDNRSSIKESGGSAGGEEHSA